MNTKRRGGEGPRRGRVGALLGAALVVVAGFSSTAAAQELTTLYSFTGGGTGDGANPDAGLIADAAGNLYGTTINGGANDAGTVFQLTPSGILSMLYSFSGGSDGAYPSGDLFADAAGNFYGQRRGAARRWRRAVCTTSSGGATASCPGVAAQCSS